MQKNTTAAKIHTTFFALAKETPAEQITIHSLASAAGISRSTFYSYYENLNDLVVDLENNLVNPIIEILDRHWQLPLGNPKCSTDILIFTKEHAEEFYILRYLKNSNLVIKLARVLKNHLHKRLRYLQIPYDEFQIFFAMSMMLNMMIPSAIFPGEIPGNHLATAVIAEQISKSVARLFQ